MTKKIFLILALILLTATTTVEAADENDSPFETLASTYSEGATEALALVKSKANGSLGFAAVDFSGKEIAFADYSRELYEFYLQKDVTGGCPPILFALLLPDQERGQLDDELGAWKDKFHIMPVYALFNMDNGQVVCEKPFYSASDPNATHFQAPIQNPKHTRLIEILLTQMPLLHERIQAKGITLP